MPRCFVLFALALAPATASASMPDLFGYGARGVGMAGAVVSTAGGHEAVYYNPAGLAYDEAVTFALAYQRADFFLDIDGARVDTRPAPAALIGFGVPLPFGGFLERRVTLGYGFVVPFRSILLADVPRAGEPKFALVGNRAQTVSLQVAAGVRLTDWLSVGGGFLALAELNGSIDVAPNDAGRIGSKVSDELIADYAPVVGVMVRATQTSAIGLTFHGESSADFSLPITADLGEDFRIPVPELAVSGTAQYDPRQVALEVSGRPWAPLLVAGGVTWKQWSRFPRPIEIAAAPPDDPALPEPDFQDTVTWRAGVEGGVIGGALELVGRAGYAFEPSPAPEQRGLNNLLDNDRHIIGAGVGVRWRALRLDVSHQWQQLVSRSHTKEPARLAPFGPPEESSGYPTIRHTGRVTAWAIELGVAL